MVASHNSHGHVLYRSQVLRPDLRQEAHFNVVGNRPSERLGEHGGFDKGVVILNGGKPHDVPVDAERNHGTVIYESSKLAPDLSFEGRTNVVGKRPDERVGEHGGFGKGVVILNGGKPQDVPVDQEIINRGKVLYVSKTYAPDLRFESKTNVIAKRPDERLGSRGGFSQGVCIISGGPPRDVPVKPELNHGTVLYQSHALTPVVDDDVELNERGDRVNSGHGAFTHGVVLASGGDLHADLPVAEQWEEAGQKGGRRGSQGHFQCGVTTLCGGQPSYESPEN